MSKRSSPATPNDPPTTPKRPRQTILSSALTPTLPSLSPTTTISAPLTDRKSTFKAFFTPLSHPSTLQHHKTLLSNLPELATADHKIMAWNVGLATGFDDDGEKWAGRKVLDLLLANEDQGLVCVVRWYGGIMLGPVRFDHIVHVAADALATYHLRKRPPLQLTPPTLKTHAPLPTAPLPNAPLSNAPPFNAPPFNTAPFNAPPPPTPQSPSQTPLSSETNEQTRLLRVLRGKDMTIENLRGTITAKKLEMGQSPSSSPVKARDYERMSVEGLNRLLAGRDRTIQSLRGIYKELVVEAEGLGREAGDEIGLNEML